MNRITLLILILSLLTVNGYSKKRKVKVSYELTKPYDIRLDTINKELIYKNYKDKKYHLVYNWDVFYSWDPDTIKVKEEYEFIMNEDFEAYRFNPEREYNEKVKLKFVESKDLNLLGKTYKIYKYLYDEESSIDEEELLFFTPEYGIIMIKPLSWPSYVKLLNFDMADNDRIINKLCEVIIYDSHYFRSYTKRKPLPMEILIEELLKDGEEKDEELHD